MANPTLEKNQKKFYDDVDATYNVEVSGGGAEPVKGPEIKALKPDIRLHFLRYGLFDRNTDYDSTEDIDAPEYEDPKNKVKGVLIKDDKSVCGDVKLNSTQQATNKKDKPQELVIDLEEVEVLTLENLPKLDNFYVSRTGLSKGYIYLINDKDQDDYHEVYVNESGQLQHILWENSKDDEGNYLDIRKPSGSKIEYKLVKPGSKYWVGYSTIQWSCEQVYEMNSDAEKRKARMRLVDCSGIEKGKEEANKHIFPFTKVTASFPQNSPRAGALESMLHSILADEKKQDEKGKNNLYEDMFIVLNNPLAMAYDINEVVSSKVLQHKALIEAIHSGETQKQAYNRLLEGRFQAPAPDKNYAALFNLALTTYHFVYNKNETVRDYDGGKEGNDFGKVHPEDDKMVTKVLATYDSDGMKPISYSHDFTYQVPNKQFALGHGVSHDKVIGILGAKARKKTREIAIKYRNDLGNLLDSSFLRKDNYIDDYLKNIKPRLVDGRIDGLDLLENLVISPLLYEKTLLLKRHHGTKYVFNDKWVKWCFNITDANNKELFKQAKDTTQASGFEGLDPFYALITAGFNIDKVHSKSLKTGKKIISVAKKKIKFHAGQTYLVKGKLTEKIASKQRLRFILSQLNEIKYKGRYFFEFIENEIKFVIDDAIAAELDIEEGLHRSKNSRHHPKNKYYPKVSAERRLKRVLQEDMLVISKNKKHIEVEVGVNVTKQVTHEIDVKIDKHHKLAEFTKSKKFTGFLALIEYVNFIHTVTTTIEDRKTKGIFKSVESSFKLAEASMNLRQAVLKSQSKDITARFQSLTKVAGAVGAVFTAGMCAWDSVELFNKQDSDAGWAMVGASVAFTVAAGVSITAAAAASSGAVAASIAAYGTALGLAGPVGWVAALVGVGFIILAQLFTDTKLQAYFKYYLLSDRKTKGFLLATNETPMQYNRRLYENRTKLVDLSNENAQFYYDPYLASTIFADLVICPDMQVKARFQSIKTGHSHKEGISSYDYKAKKIVALFKYNKFFREKEQVECKFYLARHGTDGNKIELKNHPYDVDIVLNDNGDKLVQVTLELGSHYRELMYRPSVLLFFTRLRINESVNHYFPFSIKEEYRSGERWLGAKISVFTQNSYSVHDAKHIKFVAGPMYKLLKKNFEW